MENFKSVMDDFQEANAIAPQLPLLLDALGFSWIDRNVHCRDVIGERARIAQRSQRAAVHAADRYNHTVPDNCRRSAVPLQGKLLGQPAIVVVDI